MQCPTCNITLIMTERQGIEIDYCPQCRGIWLDRGELDKLIERSAQDSVTSQPTTRPMPAETYRDPRHSGDRYHGKHKKRKSLLGELFDF